MSHGRQAVGRTHVKLDPCLRRADKRKTCADINAEYETNLEAKLQRCTAASSSGQNQQENSLAVASRHAAAKKTYLTAYQNTLAAQSATPRTATARHSLDSIKADLHSLHTQIKSQTANPTTVSSRLNEIIAELEIHERFANQLTATRKNGIKAILESAQQEVADISHRIAELEKPKVSPAGQGSSKSHRRRAQRKIHQAHLKREQLDGVQ